MNVGWGKHGATSSTPRVLNECVTLESNAAAAGKQPTRRTHKRSFGNPLSRTSHCQSATSGRIDSPGRSGKEPRGSLTVANQQAI